jgi:Domain of unknown function (DUF4412)
MRLTLRLIGVTGVALSLAGAARADTKVTMEEQTVITTPGGAPPTEQTTQYTLWVRADRAARIGGGLHMITRLDRGESYFVDDGDKTVTVMKLDGLPETLRHPEVKKTGETRRIGAWNAERYDLSVDLGHGDTGSVVLWISDDVALDMNAYRAFYRAADRGQGLLSAIADLPGYPVLEESNFGIAKSTARLVAVSEETPPSGTYDPPADYARKD